MDELRRQALLFAERWSRFPRGQRLAMSATLLFCVVGFSFVIGRSTNSDWQPVCGGRDFTSKEMAATQSIWRQNGLKDFCKEGQRLCVPKSELSRYEALIPKSKTEETAATSEWEKQLARTNLFSTSEVVEQHRDNALRNELRRLIKAIPAIADADVIWARSKGKSAFSSRPKVTATVNVTPQDGHDVTPELAQSLRTAVANMVADLNAQDVVILDQSTGLAITDHMDVAIAQQQRQRQLERLSQQVESKITSALSTIPGVLVKVSSIAPNERNHFAARPIHQAAETTAAITTNTMGPEIYSIGASQFWTNDAPNDLVTFAKSEVVTDTLPAHNQFRSAFVPHSNDPVRDQRVSQFSTPESSNQIPSWRITVLLPHDFGETQSALSLIEQAEPSDVAKSEIARLKQLVTGLLPPNAPATEVVVIESPSTDRMDNLPETQAAITAFTAWPHAVCLLFGIVVVTSFTRPRHQARQSPQNGPQDSTDNINPMISAADLVHESHSTNQSTELPTATQSHLASTMQSPEFNDRLFDDDRNEKLAELPSATPPQSPPNDQSRHSEHNHTTLARNNNDDAIHELQQADPQQLSEALRHERPQAIAVMLTQFSSTLASETLAGLPTSLQIEVIRRLKSLGEISPELVNEIAQAVCRRLHGISLDDSWRDPTPSNRIAHLFNSSMSSKTFA